MSRIMCSRTNGKVKAKRELSRIARGTESHGSFVPGPVTH
jgi:hypothetical protein